MTTTITLPTTVPPDVRADFDAVVQRLQTGKPLDPQVERRIHERAQRIRREILASRGVQNVGVGIIREIRG